MLFRSFTFKFDWGDGTSSTVSGREVASPHTYAAAGTFTVSVTATDKDGATSAAGSGGVTRLALRESRAL